MRRKSLITAAAVALALIPMTGIGIAEAHGGGFRGGGFHGRDFGRREFRNGGIRFGGVFGGYFPGYYGPGRCYLTIYGTTYCY